MISAGENTTPATQPPPASGYYPQQPAGLQAPPAFTPITLPQSNAGPQGPNMNINWEPKGPNGDKFMENYMMGQFGLQLGGVVANMLTTGLNYALASQAMEAQLSIAEKYYDVQDNIAGYQMKVAIRQMDVQGKAIDAQTKMHAEQCRHEEKMAKLSGTTQARLAAIGEKGKTERAKIFAVTDAFSRSGWDMGSPAIAA